MIRVLIADDSAFMRKVLSDMFNRQSDFEVAGTAINGRDTIDKVKKLNPDLLTLDVTMPVMDGLNALAVIMEECPLPVVMVSSTTQAGTDATVRALALGAVDFISKAGGPISKIDAIETELLTKCRAAAKAHVSKFRMTGADARPLIYRYPTPEPPSMKKIEVRRKTGLVLGQKPTINKIPSKLAPPVEPAMTATFNTGNSSKKLVVIGTSTGGPQALQTVITRLPGNLPCGVVVVQHMPPGFTKSLADRLNAISEIAVKEAEHDEIIKPGQVYIAPGDYQLRIVPMGINRKIVLSKDAPVGNHRPAVNVMYDSAAEFGKDIVAVIMTGMGSDGCIGMKKIKAQGGYSIAQDEQSCVVYGMPKAVVDAGLADEIRPLTKIAEAIVEAVRR